MFRQTPFTKSDLARSIVARETATKVRYFDPETARWSGWMPKPPMLRAVRAMEGIATAVQATVVAVHGLAAPVYASMPVGQLRKLASEKGVKNASRMRKADILAALTQTVTA